MIMMEKQDNDDRFTWNDGDLEVVHDAREDPSGNRDRVELTKAALERVRGKPRAERTRDIRGPRA